MTKNSRLTKTQVISIRNRLMNKESTIKELSIEYGVRFNVVWEVSTRKTWSDV